jgi:two-component system response regulator HydG
MATPDLVELVSYLDNLPNPKILLDRNYTVIAANKAFRDQFHNSQPVLGRHCYEISHHFTRPCDEMGESCPLKAARRSGSARRVLHVHHTPRGEEHVDVETVPVKNAAGEIEYFVETLQTVRSARADSNGGGLAGRSPAFTRMLGLLRRVASSDAAVLLLGESGTGKEMAAQALHESSTRAAGPFVAVDCSGLSETLFESELFGYEKGAFTGAGQRKPGLVEAASGGTLFLDEVGDIPLGLQVKLLRLLETGTYRRVGGIEPLRADFRLVAATHRDLPKMVAAETFRKDLYYRINTFPVELPALRDRLEDLPMLAEVLLKRVCTNRAMVLHPDALACLMAYDFPGNVRELRNILERACLLADGNTILPEHLPVPCGDQTEHAPRIFSDIVPLEEIEQRYLRWIMRQPGASRKDLAKRLGVSERTLFRKLSQLREE